VDEEALEQRQIMLRQIKAIGFPGVNTTLGLRQSSGGF